MCMQHMARGKDVSMQCVTVLPSHFASRKHYVTVVTHGPGISSVASGLRHVGYADVECPSLLLQKNEVGRGGYRYHSHASESAVSAQNDVQLWMCCPLLGVDGFWSVACREQRHVR